MDRITPVKGKEREICDPLRQRLNEAWKSGRTNGEAIRPALIMIGGYAGSGKTEISRFIAQLTGWPILDKDPLTRPLAEALLVALGSDPNDRHSDLYRENVRPLEYKCLMESAISNIQCGISTVLSAPFIKEMTDAACMRELADQVMPFGAEIFPVWVRCDQESMYEHITFRAAARDGWKLQQWDEYAATIDFELRPSVPHHVIDNRLGSMVGLLDRARQALARSSCRGD
ncbi:AAA family ATPase [Streptomyces sp. NPDC056549]|uniref:AAA family ATPase n=1 Tax=Streptomyces sp. NPDC056549 TaxID=3345864 RepID=UPI0036CB92BA